MCQMRNGLKIIINEKEEQAQIRFNRANRNENYGQNFIFLNKYTFLSFYFFPLFIYFIYLYICFLTLIMCGATSTAQRVCFAMKKKNEI